MKVAEALLRRKELLKEVNTLQSQFTSNIVVNDGVKPRRDAFKIEKQFFDRFAELEKLIISINTTNNTTIINGISVMQMIARRDALKLLIPQYGVMYQQAEKAVRDGLTKVNAPNSKGDYVKVINPSQPVEGLNTIVMEKSYNSMASELRQLDLQLQALTWQVDLITV